ncbi:hypothetical protein MRX96_031541 [Rhipicephalus microplus]
MVSNAHWTPASLKDTKQPRVASQMREKEMMKGNGKTCSKINRRKESRSGRRKKEAAGANNRRTCAGRRGRQRIVDNAFSPRRCSASKKDRKSMRSETVTSYTKASRSLSALHVRCRRSR